MRALNDDQGRCGQPRLALTEVAPRDHASEDSQAGKAADYSPGVGGSVPSLATMFSVSYQPSHPLFGSIWFQTFNQPRLDSSPNQGFFVLNERASPLAAGSLIR